jgi:hypothetical protein
LRPPPYFLKEAGVSYVFGDMNTLRFLTLIFILVASCSAPLRAGPPPPVYHSYDTSVPTTPIMCDESNGWRLDAGTKKCAVLLTGDGGRHWIDVSPPALPGIVKEGVASGDDFSASLSPSDQKRAWVAMTDVKKVLVAYTTDGGRHWSEYSAPASISFEVYINFLDEKHGFLLEVSDPASGHERRKLYGTGDGAKHWHTLAPPGGDYPTGITFRTPMDGWTTADYTSDDDTLYCTHDGGITWKVQKFPIPKEFSHGYANTEPPVFTGPGKKHGYLPVHLAEHNSEPTLDADVTYETTDGGLTWHLPASGVKIVKGE